MQSTLRGAETARFNARQTMRERRDELRQARDSEAIRDDLGAAVLAAENRLAEAERELPAAEAAVLRAQQDLARAEAAYDGACPSR